MNDLTSLIERIEAATGGERELDAEIWLACTPGATRDKWSYIHKATGRECTVDETRDATDRLIIVPSYTSSLDAALTLLPEGLWWRGGTCSVSSEATVCPDHNGPHRERLLRECQPTELIWDEGIETELRPGSNNALIRALLASILRARQAAQSGQAQTEARK